MSTFGVGWLGSLAVPQLLGSHPCHTTAAAPSRPEDLVTVARKLDDAARLLKDVVRRLVIETHVRGATWDEIGAVFGVSRQAVHERFGAEQPSPLPR